MKSITSQQLLLQLYSIHAPTCIEWPMITFVREYVKEHIHETEVRIDMLGNLYITKGEAGVGYPTLACHLDQVQKLHSDDFEVREEDGTLYGWSQWGRFSLITPSSKSKACFRSGSGPLLFKRMNRFCTGGACHSVKV